MTPVVKSVELPNRVTLSYVEQGDRSGAPVVLLHGVTDSWHSFDLVLPHLPESIHAFALTQRGHGDSSRPATGYRFGDFAADVAAFMDALQIESAIVVGHSMGSSVAQRFAIDYPERTLGLVLIAAFAGLRGNPDVLDLWNSVISTMTGPVDPGFAREFQESTLGQRVPPAFFETIMQECLKVPARVWKAVFEGFLEDDFSDQLSKIKTPVLIVWGDQDVFCRRTDQDALLAAISGSRLIEYPGNGHAVHWEQPERFVSDLKAFVEEVTSNRKAPNC
ncbi:MAG TPA: alpha/beta hydrolase [Blastocatellia bacterium]|nr:alpha/beta hydrolase [Blastocatellia bacterium]